MLWPLLALLLMGLAAPLRSQPTACAAAPATYAGPCYYGALPAFFDDFAYTSAVLPAEADDSGSVFGTNAWALRDGPVQSRAWYRYNRDDLPMSGTASFEAPSILALRLREGLSADAMTRGLVLQTGVTMTAGIYHWRVRLSPHWPGQRVRQSVWLVSPIRYFFDHLTPGDTTRYAYAAELDFENETDLRDGFVVQTLVTNHVGQVTDARGSRRLSHAGPVAWHEGHAVLARTGPPRHPRGHEAPGASGPTDGSTSSSSWTTPRGRSRIGCSQPSPGPETRCARWPSERSWWARRSAPRSR